jgi:hypothetical protein
MKTTVVLAGETFDDAAYWLRTLEISALTLYRWTKKGLPSRSGLGTRTFTIEDSWSNIW